MGTLTFLASTESASLTAIAPTLPAQGITYAARGVVAQIGLKEVGPLAPPMVGAVDLDIYALFKTKAEPTGEWFHLSNMSAVDMSICPRFIALPSDIVGFEKIYIKASAAIGVDVKYFIVTEPKVHNS
jgi:hypothetical protein